MTSLLVYLSRKLDTRYIMQDNKQDLEWGLFWTRIIGGIGLLATGAIASRMIAEETAGLEWGGVGALAGMVAAFGFMLAKYRRGDEFDRAIDRVTSVQAGLATIGLIMAQELFTQIGWFADPSIPVYSMPGFFILYKTILAQYLRAALASGRNVSGIASLRA